MPQAGNQQVYRLWRHRTDGGPRACRHRSRDACLRIFWWSICSSIPTGLLLRSDPDGRTQLVGRVSLMRDARTIAHPSMAILFLGRQLAITPSNRMRGNVQVSVTGHLLGPAVPRSHDGRRSSGAAIGLSSYRIESRSGPKARAGGRRRVDRPGRSRSLDDRLRDREEARSCPAGARSVFRLRPFVSGMFVMPSAAEAILGVIQRCFSSLMVG